MADNRRTIRIESILGGFSRYTHFANSDEYHSALGIDPLADASVDYTLTGLSYIGNRPSGLIVPTATNYAGTTSTTGSPRWILGQPKGLTYFYVYDNVGSVYSMSSSITPLTGIGDLNDGGTATGNGAAYYDNYLYFARDTSIARYGPLDGTPAFTDDYWVTTLSKTALTEFYLPGITTNVGTYPNHVLHSHSDGKLYIADYVGSQGTIHFIQTSKTTVEGDTDAGSTYDALNFGYGLKITAMETYGEMLVIALYDGASNESNPRKAKLAFWDTTSANANSITWNEFPDNFISSIRNVNGVLYVFSRGPEQLGFRVSRVLGSNSFEEVAYIGYGYAPPHGATSVGKRLMFTSRTMSPENAAGVWALGVPSNPNALHNILRVEAQYSEDTGVPKPTALLAHSHAFEFMTSNDGPIVGYSSNSQNQYSGILARAAIGSLFSANPNSLWVSQIYRVGQPFKILSIRIPVVEQLASSDTFTVGIKTDGGEGQSYSYQITGSADGTNKLSYVVRPSALVGDNDFFITLTIDSDVSISLPITITYELLDIETNYA